MGFYTEKDIEIEKLREENARLKAVVEEIRREESYWRYTVVAKKLCPVHDNLYISHDCVEEILNERAILIRERDEARAEVRRIGSAATERWNERGLREENDRLRSERDEARAEVARLRDIISPGDAAAYEHGMAALQAKQLRTADALAQAHKSSVIASAEVARLEGLIEAADLYGGHSVYAEHWQALKAEACRIRGEK